MFVCFHGALPSSSTGHLLKKTGYKERQADVYRKKKVGIPCAEDSVERTRSRIVKPARVSISVSYSTSCTVLQLATIPHNSDNTIWTELPL